MMRQHRILPMKIMDRISAMMVNTFPNHLSLDSALFAVLCPDLYAERPREHESLNNIIIVDNLPKVDQAKLEKLKAVVSKVYSKFGICRNEYYPLDDEGKTKG